MPIRQLNQAGILGFWQARTIQRRFNNLIDNTTLPSPPITPWHILRRSPATSSKAQRLY